MIIQFSNIGRSIGTRILGEQFRMKIERALKENQFVTFDFQNVEVISHSFADECFGKLLNTWSLENLRTLTTFKNTSGFIKKTIAFALNERLTDKEV